MSLIQNIIREEHQRLQDLHRKYIDKIDALQKGAASIKKRHKREYLYLARRIDGKVRFDYIGRVDSKKAQKVLGQLRSRKEYEQKLRQVKSDLREIERVIHRLGYRRRVRVVYGNASAKDKANYGLLRRASTRSRVRLTER